MKYSNLSCIEKIFSFPLKRLVRVSLSLSLKSIDLTRSLNFKFEKKKKFPNFLELRTDRPTRSNPSPYVETYLPSRGSKCNLINSKLAKTLQRFLLKLINHHNSAMNASAAPSRKFETRPDTRHPHFSLEISFSPVSNTVSQCLLPSFPPFSCQTAGSLINS